MPRLVTPLPATWVLQPERLAPGAPAVGDVAATVPGCTHTDLLAAGVIPDPFVDTNETDVAWVADSDWRYRCEFEVTADQIAHEVLELKFEGLDTLATVIVNGHVVAETANMHRRYRFDVGGVAVPGTNMLEIVFRSATRHAEVLRASEGDWPSSSFGRPFNFVRKMACSWGWDWGPWLTGAGVWRPATLEAWSDGRLSDIRPRPLVDGDDRGRLVVDVDAVRLHADTDATVTVELRDADGSVVATSTEPVAVGTTRLELDAGTVRRWWPHSLGDPVLYELTARLTCVDGSVCDEKRQRIGFRTIELDTSPDATGSAFTFVVNGVPIFVRGVNWIPDDVFPSRITLADYCERIGQAIDAHVDLLRVWGGGIYEDDRFYDLCDELGVLVWQDFPFACAAYPEHLLADEVEAEAHGNVSRLMPHPSLAIWNGNNENIWGYWDWGWQDVLQDRAWGAGFYHDLLPRVCAELDPDRPYWPGSPSSGSQQLAPNADAHGCVHVWDVWNQLDLDRYRDRTPRFVAEFGWQAPPTSTTFDRHVTASSFDRTSAVWAAHQKATDGDRKLDRGIVARFGEVRDLDAFWYAAQLVQARAVRTGVEHFRSLQPYCAGTIWWQLNDCWPATSWALVDSDGRPKPAWYALRDAYRDRLLTVQPRGDRLVLFAVNATPEPWVTDLPAVRVDLAGTELARRSLGVRVEPRAVAAIELPDEVAVPNDPTDEVVAVGGAPERAWWWFAPDRELHLRCPTWSTELWHDGDELVVEVTSDVVVRDLVLAADRLGPRARIDRQVVDLLPGEPQRFRLAGADGITAEQLLRRPVGWHAGMVADR